MTTRFNNHANSLIMKIYSFLKSLVSAILIVVVLHFTGLLSAVSGVTQKAVLKTGILDADTDEEVDEEDFDYNFTLKDLKGNKVSFDQYKGKVVFLNLWATWCGPCKAEMPAIQKLYDKAKGKNIEFVMLSIDKAQALPKVEEYVNTNSYTFPVFMPSGFLAEPLQVRSIPTTFVISKEGKIIMKEVGTKNYDTKRFLNFLEEHAK